MLTGKQPKLLILCEIWHSHLYLYTNTSSHEKRIEAVTFRCINLFIIFSLLIMQKQIVVPFLYMAIYMISVRSRRETWEKSLLAT